MKILIKLITNISDIKNLVSYYNISKNLEDINKINFSISFDKGNTYLF